MENLDKNAIKGELNFYRKYCDRAAELINDTKEEAPYATEVLRKGLPILDRNLKGLIEEIQKKANIACKESIGTATEEIARAVNKEIQEREIIDALEVKQFVEDMAYSLERKIIDTLENKPLLNKIILMRNEKNIGKQLNMLSYIIGNLPTIIVVSEQELVQKLRKFDIVYDEIVNVKDKLSCISFNTFNIGLNSYNMISNLNAIKEDLENLKKISNSNMSSLEVSNSNLTEQLNDLNEILQNRLDELGKSISGLPQNEKTMEILSKLNESKQSKLGNLIQTPASIATLIGSMIQIIQLCQQYLLF